MQRQIELDGGNVMKKRLISIILAMTLILGVLPMSASAAGGLSNFVRDRTYTNGQFSDVATTAWYAPNVQLSYEYGLIDGKSSTTFAPNGEVTIGETIKLAAVLHSIYSSGEADFPSASPWYKPYVDYALENEIINAAYKEYNNAIVRSEFAMIFAKALPAEALAAINTVNDGDVPDVPMSYSYSDAVYLLYRAGVLTGSDSKGNFTPNTTIKRSEAAAIVTRMANASYRKSITLSEISLSAKEIAKTCMPAVFYIEVFSKEGKLLGTGSGFFISSSGVALTNYHVMERAYSAKITTNDKKTYDVKGSYSLDEANDLALIQIDGKGFSTLDIGSSENLTAGETVFALGSPLGIADSISTGIVSNPKYVYEDIPYIVTSAPISSGSSGGALVDAAGKVIGVTTGSFTYGQNLNVAVPIHLYKKLEQKTITPLSKTAKVPEIKAEVTKIDAQVGRTTAITIEDVYNDGYDIYAMVKDESIAAATVGYKINFETYTLTYQLKVRGLKEGSTTVTLEMDDIYGDVIATLTLPITVTKPSASDEYTYVSYELFYPVPDMGVLLGAEAYDEYVEVDYAEYYYLKSDITKNKDNPLKAYADLLDSNGFECLYKPTESSEEQIYIYDVNGYGVMFYSEVYEGQEEIGIIIEEEYY